jgi:hypothetical protein
MNTAELIFRETMELPESDAQEVLDFVEFLKAKRGYSLNIVPPPNQHPPMTPEEHAALCERLRQLVESQPMTEGDTVARMRAEARY